MNYYLLLSGFLLTVGLTLHAQPVSQTFSTPGTYTWTVPAGYTATIQVEAWGGGAGGGIGPGEQGGGGGGAYARSIFEVTPGDYGVTVGDGGTPGNPGLASSFASSVIALGGSSGTGLTGFAGGDSGGSTGDVTYSGGDGGDTDDCFFNDAGGGGGDSGGDAADGDDGGDAFCALGFGVGGISGFGDPQQGGNGGAGSGAFANGSAGTAPGGGGGGKGDGGTSGFGAAGQVIVTVNIILPIELLSFDASLVTEGVALDWITVSEINNDYMAVERSLDGREFREIGRINGKGTTYEEQSYRFIDRLPAAGLNYYRLRQVDFDGTTTYHRIVSVRVEDRSRKLELMAFPNPTRDRLNLRWTAGQEGTASVQVFDIAGRVLLAQQVAAGGSTYELPVNTLPAGSYWLRLNVGEALQVVRFEKLD